MRPRAGPREHQDVSEPGSATPASGAIAAGSRQPEPVASMPQTPPAISKTAAGNATQLSCKRPASRAKHLEQDVKLPKLTKESWGDVIAAAERAAVRAAWSASGGCSQTCLPRSPRRPSMPSWGTRASRSGHRARPQPAASRPATRPYERDWWLPGRGSNVL